ncbi:MAG: HEPN domain-containing protein [Coriobacteriia bacterium]|nr:HEPN domain-containing protein [Coriobacteriia bacterium]
MKVLVQRRISHALCLTKLAEILDKTHDLVRLGGELQARGSDLPQRIRPLCEQLAERYFSGRYPGFDLDDENWPRLRRQVREIEGILEIVKARSTR